MTELCDAYTSQAPNNSISYVIFIRQGAITQIVSLYTTRFITMTSYKRVGVSNHQSRDCLLNR